MKNILKTVIVLAIPLMAGMTVIDAQAQKLGHINSNELLSLMPEREKATKEVENFTKQLEDQLKVMSAEYDSKAQDYQSKEGIMTDPVKQTKLRELQDLGQRIQDFQQTAQQSLQKKENEGSSRSEPTPKRNKVSDPTPWSGFVSGAFRDGC